MDKFCLCVASRVQSTQMRIVTFLLLAGALLLTLVSLLIDLRGADPGSLPCRIGLCRKDQILDTLKNRPSLTNHADIIGFRRLIAMAPADAYAWAALAEYLNSDSSSGSRDARKALDRAVELAPEVAHIRMRRANLCFETGDKNCVLYDGREVVGQTANFDGILFSYYKSLNVGLDDVLEWGLPKEARAARSWAIYLTRNANSSFHILRTWDWLRERGLADAATVCRLTHELVRKGDPETAWRVWSDYRVAAYGQQDGTDRLTNAKFERQPLESPFDWSVTPQPGVSFRREGGLEVSFQGETNLSLANVRQVSFVRSGHHRLVVDVAHEGLTTDQGPYVRLFDAEQPGRLSVQTEMFRGSAGRRTVAVDFVVPPGSRLLAVQLERRPSEKFENKIAGTLHLYRVSLTELNAKGHAISVAGTKGQDLHR